MFETFVKQVQDQNIVRSGDVLGLLKLQGAELKKLYLTADLIRKNTLGDDIHLRGIIEISNICEKDCNYCGIRRSNQHFKRYKMTTEEIVSRAEELKDLGIRTVVLQSGESKQYPAEEIATIIQKIKSRTGMAVTLSLGEHSVDDYILWHQSGLDRYLLRYETSDRDLYQQCHPDSDLDQRLQSLKVLQKIGVQTGSGFLIGLPGQSLEQLAKEIIFTTEMKLHMIGCGPFIADNNTPFAGRQRQFDTEIYFKTMAILRLLNPEAHIPSTTAFEVLEQGSRMELLNKGCNVFMPNLTPRKFREDYQLYPGKTFVDKDDEHYLISLKQQIRDIGRNIACDLGHSIVKNS